VIPSHPVRASIIIAEVIGPALRSLGPRSGHAREARMRPETTSPTPSPTAPQGPRPPRVLIAEDNPQGAELLEAYLSDSGYELRIAVDGEQALKEVSAWKPELILLDIMMPRISGFEVCKRLRADPATRDIAVLMITALDQPSDVDRALDAGAEDLLSKPVNKNVLLLRVRSLLRSRQYKRELDRALAYIEAVEQGGG
jgi:PleD family two-component response regulator